MRQRGRRHRRGSSSSCCCCLAYGAAPAAACSGALQPTSASGQEEHCGHSTRTWPRATTQGCGCPASLLEPAKESVRLLQVSLCPATTHCASQRAEAGPGAGAGARATWGARVVAVLARAGQPRPNIVQHHLLLPTDQPAMLGQSLVQSKGSGVVVTGQPRPEALQHHSLFPADHLSSPPSPGPATSQLKGAMVVGQPLAYISQHQRLRTGDHRCSRCSKSASQSKV
mmetsp:Transcript_77125/g.213153  ORF Transcript_77125/g.213153 Transcript_77125/m.213153 type:complete len:227 (+) Transcript_77125:1574-2254(+)